LIKYHLTEHVGTIVNFYEVIKLFVGHVNTRGKSLHQRIPFPMDVIGAKLEYRVMAALGRITDADYLYRFGPSRSFFNWLANRLVVPLVHGEVLTLDEVENILFRLHREGHQMALGICECRHGENRMESELVDGQDPNFTCVMIGDWGKAHLYSFPQYYRPVGPEELLEKARFWHRHGRVLSSWGCSTVHGFMVSYCHCLPYYCVPLRNQLKRGNQVFFPGYRCAVVDPELCVGPDHCEHNCPERCFFGAIKVVNSKARVDPAHCHGCGQCFTYCPTGAATSFARKGHQLRFCPPDLVAPPD